MLEHLKLQARRFKAEIRALYLAARHPATPWQARLVVAGVVAYALSPIDLIPDFIPVLGYLDDLVLLPLGIALALRLVPPAVLAECRAQAAETAKPVSLAGATVIVALWLALAVWAYAVFGAAA